jgi:hypothetical protein
VQGGVRQVRSSAGESIGTLRALILGLILASVGTLATGLALAAGGQRPAVPVATPSPPEIPLGRPGLEPFAQEVVKGLQKAGQPLGVITFFLATLDPNPPLGIADSYAGANFIDRTLPPPPEDTYLGYANGGSIEVFPTAAQRAAREQSLRFLHAAGATLVGRDQILLILSPQLTPPASARYLEVFKALQLVKP